MNVLDIEARLAAVERSMRRWRLASLACVVVVVFCAADVATKDVKFGKVTCSELEVVNDKGVIVSAISKTGRGDFSDRVVVCSPTPEKSCVALGSLGSATEGWFGTVFVYDSDGAARSLSVYGLSDKVR